MKSLEEGEENGEIETKSQSQTNKTVTEGLHRYKAVHE